MGRNSHVSVCCQLQTNTSIQYDMKSQLARKRMLPGLYTLHLASSSVSQLARKRMLPAQPGGQRLRQGSRNSHVSVCCQSFHQFCRNTQPMSQRARKRMLPVLSDWPAPWAASRNSHVSVCCQALISARVASPSVATRT